MQAKIGLLSMANCSEFLAYPQKYAHIGLCCNAIGVGGGPEIVTYVRLHPIRV